MFCVDAFTTLNFFFLVSTDSIEWAKTYCFGRHALAHMTRHEGKCITGWRSLSFIQNHSDDNEWSDSMRVLAFPRKLLGIPKEEHESCRNLIFSGLSCQVVSHSGVLQPFTPHNKTFAHCSDGNSQQNIFIDKKDKV